MILAVWSYIPYQYRVYVTDVFDDAPRDVTSPFRTSALVKQGPGPLIGQSGHPPWRYRVLCVYPIPGPPPLQPTSFLYDCPPASLGRDQPDFSLAGDLGTRPSRTVFTHHSPPQPKPPLSFSFSLFFLFPLVFSFSHLIIIIIIISSFPFFLFFFFSSSSSFIPSNIFQQSPPPSSLLLLSLFLFFLFFLKKNYSLLSFFSPPTFPLPPPPPLYSTYPPLPIISHAAPSPSHRVSSRYISFLGPVLFALYPSACGWTSRAVIDYYYNPVPVPRNDQNSNRTPVVVSSPEPV